VAFLKLQSGGVPLSGVDGVKVVNLDSVIAAEKKLLREQRQAAGQASGSSVGQAGGGDVNEDGFIGVSHSGGGVRAGAVALGFLMGLHQRGLLRLVDYLSTVSGGGYAGGVLTAERAAEPNAASESRRLFGEPAGGSWQGGSVQRGGLARLREMVTQCNYLIRNQSWMSRALLGVAAMGTVSICTMIFLTAFLAWSFRLLYLPPVLEFLSVLGFEGDLTIPMTPALGMFLLWLCCWLLSFFRHYRTATGRTAGYVFRGFLFCTVLGVTMIAVTGDVDAEQFLRHTGVSKDLWKQVSGLGGWLKSGILALIGASLIPYFRPSALLRSGRERAAGPKKFLFVLARNGLLLGIPLISFGMLAREDISAWNRDRDYRFEFKDLLPAPAALSLELGPQLELFRQFEEAGESSSADAGGLTALRKSLKDFLYTPQIAAEWRYYCKCQREYEMLNAGEAQQSEAAQLSRLNSANELSRFERLSMLISHLLLWEQPSAEGSDFARMRYLLSESRKSERRMMFLLNTRLMNPDLHRELPVLKSRAAADGSVKAVSATDEAALDAARAMYAQLWRDCGGRGAYEHCELYSRLKGQMNTSASLFVPDRVSAMAGDQYADGLQREAESAICRSIVDLPASMQLLFELPQQSSGGVRDKDLAGEQFLSSLLRCNHALVEAAFPGAIRRRGANAEIFSSVVHTRDQEIRWSVMVWSFWVALVLSAVCDLNSLSWHGFYSRQLGMFWIRAGYENYRALKLKVLSGSPKRPLHLMNAAVCLTGRSQVEDQGQGENPDHFLLSPMFCGSSHPGIGFVRTGESLYGDLQLADAVALSGAALSPWATTNPLARVLLLVMNLRTGLWLPNPGKIQGGELQRRSWDTIIDRHLFSPLRWLALRFVPAGLWTLRPRDPEQWSHLLVTDGGHYENLGIEALLQRRCRLIVALDASEDGDYEFQGLGIALNRARTRDGLQFFDAHKDQPLGFPHVLVPDDKTRYSSDRFFAIRVVYPDGENDTTREGLLLIVKSCLLSSDPFELQQHRKEFAAFPNDPTSDQFFAPDKFEAYRFLGFTSACQLADRLQISGSTDGKDLLEAVRSQFFTSGDPERIIGNLEAALKEYVQTGTLQDGRELSRNKLLRVLQQWSAVATQNSLKPASGLFAPAQLQADVQVLLKDPAFERHWSVLRNLQQWLGAEAVQSNSKKGSAVRRRKGQRPAADESEVKNQE
jgi:hypothetical protein